MRDFIEIYLIQISCLQHMQNSSNCQKCTPSMIFNYSMLSTWLISNGFLSHVLVKEEVCLKKVRNAAKQYEHIIHR